MKNAHADNENVIEISFGTAVPNDIAHPASKNYPEATGEEAPSAAEQSLCDDPLEELLLEGMDFEEEVEEEDYIHAHQQPFKHRASYAEDSFELASSALERLRRLREDSKRLRYYLDELNID